MFVAGFALIRKRGQAIRVKKTYKRIIKVYLLLLTLDVGSLWTVQLSMFKSKFVSCACSLNLFHCNCAKVAIKSFMMHLLQ